MKRIIVILDLLLICSCSSNEPVEIANLASYIEGRTFETGAVIACAASNASTEDVLTFYYPVDGAKNVGLYETNAVTDNKNDFSKYYRVNISGAPFFNGHLGVYRQVLDIEKWAIVTFELDNDIKISNPIRLKQIIKPTLWNDEVEIEELQAGMPNFQWADNPVGDNAIYFQVISNPQNDLLSGTYTYENRFQYYNTDNVVLNVTTQKPPDLISNTQYNFTLMDVSEDNWVNWVVQKPFEIQ